MLQDKYLNKLKELPEPVRQFGGLVTITVIVILSFAILNIFWGGGDELVRKMKLEEERIAKEYPMKELKAINCPKNNTKRFAMQQKLYLSVLLWVLI